MKHLFIVNPAASSRDHSKEYTQIITETCQKRGLDFEIVISQAPGECKRIAREAAQTGEELRLYACGGDGTLNEVVTGAVGYPNVAVTVFAGGSGNDFARAFSNPDAFRDIEQLLDAQEEEFDLIRCNDRYSLNICSVGLDARIGADVAHYKRLPLLSGFRAYAVSTLVNVIKGIAEHYVVDIEGEHIDSDQTMICVCNGRYYGGGFNPVPEADPTDGYLDVLLIKKVSRLQVAQVVGKYKAGRYAELAHIARYIRTKKLSIHCDKPTRLQHDGEVHTNTDFDIEVAPEKIRIFYPKSISYPRTRQTVKA